MKLRSGLLLLALIVAAWLAFFADKTPANGSVEPTMASKAKPHSAKDQVTASNAKVINDARTAPTIIDQQVEQLLLRAERFGAAHVSKDVSLFTAQYWAPPVQQMAPPPVAPPPSAPSLPFQYLGKKREGGSYEVYLSNGDKSYVVQEQSVIEGNYRIDAIQPPTMTLTYIPLKQIQTLAIGNAE